MSETPQHPKDCLDNKGFFTRVVTKNQGGVVELTCEQCGHVDRTPSGDRCVPSLGWHSTPHVGCILR